MQRLEMRILGWRSSMIMSRFFMDIVPEELKAKVLNDNRITRNTTKYNTNIVCKCSNGECKGFVLKPSYECVLCRHKICAKCLTGKAEEHECKEEDLKNAEFILNTSKPCPKCAAFIHKIEDVIKCGVLNAIRHSLGQRPLFSTNPPFIIHIITSGCEPTKIKWTVFRTGTTVKVYPITRMCFNTHESCTRIG